MDAYIKFLFYVAFTVALLMLIGLFVMMIGSAITSFQDQKAFDQTLTQSSNCTQNGKYDRI